MTRRKKNEISYLITTVVKLIYTFLKEAINKGRGIELLVSTAALAATYYGMWNFLDKIPVWTFTFPIGVYAGYWWHLFSYEKITSTKANPNWANRDWWWKLDGWEFEEEVAKIFRLNGYKATVTKKTGDGGIDVILYKDNLKYIVQCKHYQNTIPVAYMRELNGVMADFKADRAIMVASSGATKQGIDFIKNKPYFTLLDLEDMIRMGLRPKTDNI